MELRGPDRGARLDAWQLEQPGRRHLSRRINEEITTMLNDEASTSGEKEATDVPIDTNQLDVIMPNEQPSKVDLASVAASIKQTNADHDDGDNDAAVASTGSRDLAAMATFTFETKR